MEGLMMNCPLITNTIWEYGNSAFPHKKLISHLPDGTRHEYSYVFIEQVPRTSVGKFDKKEIRRLYAKGELT